MAKIFKFHSDDKVVDVDYITDGMMEHETFFLVDKKGEDSDDLKAGLNLEVQGYTQKEMVDLAASLNLNLDLYYGHNYVGQLNAQS